MISRRGLFGVMAALGLARVVPVKAEPEAPRFPQEGTELARMKWFNQTRGFGMARGLESGHEIRVPRELLEGIDEAEIRRVRFVVSWKMQERGPVAEKISDVRSWTPEERVKEVQGWMKMQGLV